MPTRNVVLTETQAELVEELVKSGRYQNASEVLRDGLRLIQKREDEDEAKIETLRALLAEAEADIAGGRTIEHGPAFWDEIRKEEVTLSKKLRE